MKSETEPLTAGSNRRLKNLSLTWKNITYKIKRKVNGNILTALCGRQQVENVQLLHGVNGGVKSGTLMAIMGPSGAGKTTLLATISRRIKGEISGEILLNGKPVDRKQMSMMSGFVPQQDLAVESLTVREHLEFMARMKMDRRIRTPTRNNRIASLMSELGINKCRYTKLSALSGGERKRVALAVELLTEPSLLFCDEPTTGLDSYGALAVVRTLRQVAETGRVVICSLHQPASGLLDLFHEVMLLASGRVAFQGTTADAKSFFDGLGLMCPATFNAAEFYVSQLSITSGKEEECAKKAIGICDDFQKSEFGQKVNRFVQETLSGSSEEEKLHPAFLDGTSPVDDYKKVHAFTQLRWLTWRSYVDCKRNYTSIILNAAMYMGIALILAAPYMGVNMGISQDGIQNMQGLLYLVVTETLFTFSYGVFHTFPRELPLLLRDIAGDLYHPGPYYVSKIAVLIPGTIVKPFLYSFMIFVIVGLKGGFSGFLFFVLPVILCATSASAVGCLMSAAFESVATASLLSVPIDFMALIFSGLFLHLTNLPPHISWMKYISQFYYGTEAVSLVQWLQIDHIDCPPNPEEPCVPNGLGVLEKYGYEDHYALDLLGLLAISAVSHLAGFLAIRIRSQKEPVY